MNKIFEIIDEMRHQFGWEKTDTIEFVSKCVLEEAQELYEAQQQEDLEALKLELADVLMYALTLSRLLDVDIETIIKEKAEIVKGRNYD